MIKLELLNKEESLQGFTVPVGIQTDNVIVGKFNVFHRGHLDMFISANEINHFVLIGSKNLDLRVKILRAALAYQCIQEDFVKIYTHSNGYVPSMVAQISSGNKINITAGSDRLYDYKRQMDQAAMYDAKYIHSERMMSSTSIIKKIQEGSYDDEDRIELPWITDDMLNEIREAYE